MSEQNLATIRRVMDAWRRGDYEAALSEYADDAEFESETTAVSLKGRDEVARGFEDWFGTFDEYWAETQELLDAGDHVVQLTREGGRGKASGVPVEQQGSLVYTLRAGKVIRVRIFSDRASALDAVGLAQ